MTGNLQLLLPGLEANRQASACTLTVPTRLHGPLTQGPLMMHEILSTLHPLTCVQCQETFGAMAKTEKIDFILEQVRLCLQRKDFVR